GQVAPGGADGANAAAASATILALPVYPHLTDTEVEHIADAVVWFANRKDPTREPPPVNFRNRHPRET
ncbi:MAG TPA: hypothetical protein VHH15_01605, partial [Actinophytocola sp.]|nr:hypothetical protein [Actinophytocola sp.]